jgi:hypothetical protein
LPAPAVAALAAIVSVVGFCSVLAAVSAPSRAVFDRALSLSIGRVRSVV